MYEEGATEVSRPTSCSVTSDSKGMSICKVWSLVKFEILYQL